MTVTPPDEPVATARPVTIDLGSPPMKVPISVAHVSAWDVASEPTASASQFLHSAPDPREAGGGDEVRNDQRRPTPAGGDREHANNRRRDRTTRC